jgi:hypothetical protein
MVIYQVWHKTNPDLTLEVTGYQSYYTELEATIGCWITCAIYGDEWQVIGIEVPERQGSE